ncbi:MAG: hypothetical protein ACLFRR_05720, partial [Spirochaetaceae bacterium]
MNDTKLLSEFRLGRERLANRIVMPPMVTWKAGKDGTVTDDHLEHYRECGGAGLTVVEATAVSPEGRLAATQLGLFDDGQIPGMRRLAADIERILSDFAEAASRAVTAGFRSDWASQKPPPT